MAATERGEFSAQANALFARVEKFQATTVSANAADWEYRDRSPNLSALREAAQLGLTGIEVERPQGGLGLGFREKVRVAEILSRQSMGFAFSIINSQNVAARLSTIGTVAHRMELLPDLLSGHRFGATALTEPGVGSDLTALATTATRAGNGWRLSGQKAWITNAAVADVFLCYAQTDPGSGADGIACFVVQADRPGFTRSKPYDVVSGSTLGVGGFTLSDYEASDSDMIVAPGEGFSAAMTGVNGARIYVAAMCCSMVRSALAEAIDRGRDRSAFGKCLLDHQGLAWMLVDVANRLEAAEALTARAVDAYEAFHRSYGADDDEAGLSESYERDLNAVIAAAAHAKKFAAEMAEPALAACMQAMGAEGLRQGHAVGRHLAEARLAHYVDGTTQIQNERLARLLDDLYGRADSTATSVAAPAETVINLVDTEPSGRDLDPHPPSVPEVEIAPSAPEVEIPVPAAPAPMPPLPGEEHRLRPVASAEADANARPRSTPPLPPDSLRRVD
jgi:alkylation response protein AidB-like acyl-CoA dehydrogenase